MVSGDNDFHDNSILACIALLHLDAQIGDSLQQAVVIGPHTIVTDVMAIPGFVIIARRLPKCSRDAFKVVLVFSCDVFIDDLKTSRGPTNESISGNDHKSAMAAIHRWFAAHARSMAAAVAKS
jgi:hypothetical protein